MASIRERTSKTGETTWAVLYRDGKKQSSDTFPSFEEADNFKSLVEIIGVDKARAEMFGTDQSRLTVDDLFEKWIAWKAASGDVTARTVKDYGRDYANWIKRPLGRRLAETVDELDVQQFVDSMRAQNLDAKSVADRHMILHSMFKFGSAKTRRLVTHNPCQETQLPKRHKKPAKGLSNTEWAAVYAAAKQLSPAAADLLLFMAGTGWRWSEAVALKVSGLEEYLEQGATVRYATMHRVSRQGVEVEDSAKSYAGFRRAKVSPAVWAMLQRRAVGKGLDDLIFTNDNGTRWYQQNFLNRTWTAILETSGIAPYPNGQRKTPHAVRHTSIAMAERAGATLPQLQRRAGHEDIQTTINVYGGMIDDLGEDILKGIDRQLLGEETSQVVSGEVLVITALPSSGDTTAARPQSDGA